MQDSVNLTAENTVLVVITTHVDSDILSMKDIECVSGDIPVVKILLVEGISNSLGPFTTATVCEACIVVLCVDDAACVEETICVKEADQEEDTVNEGVELPVARAELEKIGLFSEAIICEPFIVVVSVDNTVFVEETAWVKWAVPEEDTVYEGLELPVTIAWAELNKVILNTSTQDTRLVGVTSVDTVVVCVMTDWAQTALVSAALVDGGFDGSELVCVTILDEALFGILGHSSLPTPVRHSGSNKKIYTCW